MVHAAHWWLFHLTGIVASLSLEWGMEASSGASRGVEGLIPLSTSFENEPRSHHN